MPSHRDTASAATSFMLGRDGTVPGAAAHGGGHAWGPAAWPYPGLESRFLLGVSPPGPCPLSLRPAAGARPLLFLLVCRLRFAHAFSMQTVILRDAHVPALSCMAPGSHVGKTQWPPCVQGCEVWIQGAGKDRGGRSVGVLWGSPAPFPTAMCCWQAYSQPRQFSATCLSPPDPGAAWGAAGRGLSAGRTLLSPPLPASSDWRYLAYPSTQPAKISRQGDAMPPQPAWHERFHSKLLPCTLPHPERPLRVYE